MIIKEAAWETCSACGTRKRVSDEERGCDECAKPLGEDDSLSATVFSNQDNETVDLHFCSWACALKKLSTVKTDYFISLPYLHFDAGAPQNADDFWKAIRGFNSPEAGRGDSND